MLPDGQKRSVTREYRVTITVEEIGPGEVASLPSAPEHPFSREAEEFIDEADYTPLS